MNYTINTLFGEMLVRVRGSRDSIPPVSARAPDIFDEAVKDKFSRENKIYDEISKNQNAIYFLDDRANYMNVRSVVQNGINATTQNLIRASMKEYMDRGYSAKESFEMAHKEHKRAINDGYSALDRLTGLPNNFLKK